MKPLSAAGRMRFDVFLMKSAHTRAAVYTAGCIVKLKFSNGGLF